MWHYLLDRQGGQGAVEGGRVGAQFLMQRKISCLKIFALISPNTLFGQSTVRQRTIFPQNYCENGGQSREIVKISACSQSSFCKIQLPVVTRNFDSIKFQICKYNIRYSNFASLV